MATAPIPAPVKDITFSMTNNIKLQFVKFMIHSKPHKGKTELISTMPKPCIFAAETGLLTLRKIALPFFHLRTIDDTITATKWLRAGKYRGVYESAVLDSVSYLSSMILLEQRSDTVKYTANGQKHYGFMKDTVSDLLQALFEADLHVYVTAWGVDDYDVFGNSVVKPFVEGKALQSYLVHYFDLTGYLEWHKIAVTKADGTVGEQLTPFIQTVDANGIFARCRLQGALAAFETPNLNAIISKLTQ